MRLGLDWIWTRREVDLLADSHQYLRDGSGDGVSGWSEVAGFSRETSHHIVPLFLVTLWAGDLIPPPVTRVPPSLSSSNSQPVGRSSMPARNSRLMPSAFVTRSSLYRSGSSQGTSSYSLSEISKMTEPTLSTNTLRMKLGI
jgi:hypothetical protein